MDKKWSSVGNKSNQRWLWQAVDHKTNTVIGQGYSCKHTYLTHYLFLMQGLCKVLFVFYEELQIFNLLIRPYKLFCISKACC